eukprot:gene7297-412_t
MGCPFKNLLPAKRPADISEASDAQGEVAKCPFSSLLQRVSSTGMAGQIPNLPDLSKTAQGEASDQAKEALPPAVCPYGFSSNSGPKMSPLHCILCRTLLHQPADSESKADNNSSCKSEATEGGGLHAESSTSSLGLSDRNVSSSTSFFLQLGLQSSAGGNHQAALDRLSLCQDLLLQQIEVAKIADSAATSSGPSNREEPTTSHQLAGRLGAVYGSQGDCCRKMGDLAKAVEFYVQSLDCLRPHAEEDAEEDGDLAKAVEFYVESLECLRPHAEEDAEISQSLSVTINKLGDAKYMMDDVKGAKACYEEALTRRKASLLKRAQQDAETDAEACYEEALTRRKALLLKRVQQDAEADAENRAQQDAETDAEVADGSGALGDDAEAKSHFLEARKMLVELQEQKGWEVGDDPSQISRSQSKSHSLLHLVEQQLAGGQS